MTAILRLSAAVLGIAAILIVSGCNPAHKWDAGGTSVGSITANDTSSALVHYLSCDGRIYFVMVADGVAGNESSGPPNAKGNLKAKDGRDLAWSCTTRDGKSGKFSFDGLNLDLEKGGVFLVRAKDKKTTVEQLSVDLAKFQGGPVDEKLRKASESEPGIAEFLKASREKKP